MRQIPGIMSRHIYEMECQRDERARQASKRVMLADKAEHPARRVIFTSSVDDVPQSSKDVLMESSEKERTVFGKAVVNRTGISKSMLAAEWFRTQL